jgi:hypothetical protein
MKACESRPIRLDGGYARRGSVGALTTVRVQRSETGTPVLVLSVVKTRILEGKQ